jgi:hypothetical protein
MKPERALQLQVCQFMKMRYPKIMFWSNDSGEKKSIGLAKLNKRMRSGSKIPDLWISEARGGFHGLYIELKTTSPFKLDGKLKSNPHTEAQSKMLDELYERGFMAAFGVGLDKTIAIINLYMSQPKTMTYQERIDRKNF